MSNLNPCRLFEVQMENCSDYNSSFLKNRFMQDEYRRTHCIFFENALKLCQGMLTRGLSTRNRGPEKIQMRFELGKINLTLKIFPP